MFFLAYPSEEISATVSRKSASAEPLVRFALSWTHYVLLVRRIRTPDAREIYEVEALRGGWTVRQPDRTHRPPPTASIETNGARFSMRLGLTGCPQPSHFTLRAVAHVGTCCKVGCKRSKSVTALEKGGSVDLHFFPIPCTHQRYLGSLSTVGLRPHGAHRFI